MASAVHAAHGLSGVVALALKSIAFQKNDYTLDFFGTTDLLPILFNQNGLDIKIEKDDCRISLK